MEWTWRLHRLPAALFRYAASEHNRRRNRSREVFEAGYAILNDCAHEFSMLTYYIDRVGQSAQLAACGFDLLETYSRRGEILGPGEDAPDSSFLYYVAAYSGSPQINADRSADEHG
jgi:hypothetical protein